jgi:molybdopterin-guanine dinucleotide biosynthesis protein B
VSQGAPTLPPTVHITGFSNSGKTTLVELLIPQLLQRGVRTATIKHAHKGFDLDVQGKDSDRHVKAGAAATALIGPDGWVMMNQSPLPERDLSPVLSHLSGTADLVLVEGFKALPGPRIIIPSESGVPDIPAGSAAHLLPRSPWLLTSGELAEVVDFCVQHSTPQLPADCIVLAGGQSRRMGEANKLVEPLENAPVLMHVIATCLAATTGQVIVAAGPSQDASDQLQQLLTLDHLTPSEAGRIQWCLDAPTIPGPVGGVSAGASLVQSPSVVVVAGDMPRISHELLAPLLERLTDPRFSAAVYQDASGRLQVGLTAWNATMLQRALQPTAGIAPHSLRALCAGADDECCVIDAGGMIAMLEDIDTPADLAAMRKGI